MRGAASGPTSWPLLGDLRGSERTPPQGTKQHKSVAYYLNTDYDSACRLTGLLREWLSRGWQGSVFFTPQKYQFGVIRMIGAIVGSIEGAPAAMMIPRREPTPLSEVRDLIAGFRKIS